MGRPAILFPCRLDLDRPIQTVHREVARRLSEDFCFSCFSEGSNPAELDGFVDTIRRLPSDSSQLRKVATVLQAYLGRYDVVHTGTGGRKTHPLFLRLAGSRGAAVVHTHHTTTPNDLARQRWAANHAEIVTAVSPFVKEWVGSELGVPDVTVVPDGVDLDTFHPELATTDENVVLFVGRLVEQKHPEVVIELADRRDDLTFLVRGDGPLSSELRTRAPDNVQFPDRVGRDELATLYAQAFVTLCPFEREGFGMVVLESMASGTPVVGLDSGNLPNLVTEESGALCAGLDVDEWDRAVSDVRASLEDYEPRSRAADFSWDVVAEGYRDVYERTLAQ